MSKNGYGISVEMNKEGESHKILIFIRYRN